MGAQATAIAEAAKLIAGGAPPAWLVGGLLDCVSYLRSIADGQQRYPNRPELRKHFDAMACRLRSVAAEAQAWPFENFLGTARAELQPDLDWLAAMRTLESLAAIAERARDDVPKGHGRQLHVPNPNGLSAIELVAAVVVVGWKEARGNFPAHTADDPGRACGMVATAAKIKKAQWGDTASWREPLKRVKDLGYPRLGTLRDKFLAARTRLQLNLQ